jgi:hypothetical protein
MQRVPGNGLTSYGYAPDSRYPGLQYLKGAGWVYDYAAGGMFAGSSEDSMTLYYSNSPLTFQSSLYEFRNIPSADKLDLFFDGLDEQLFMDNTGTGAGDMWWSGDSKGANAAGTGIATVPDNKYLVKHFEIAELGSVPQWMDWSAWYQLEENWDFVQLEVSTDAGATWYALPWGEGGDPNGAAITGDFPSWEIHDGANPWTDDLQGYPSECYPALQGYGWGQYDSFITGDSPVWGTYASWLPGGLDYAGAFDLRFRYMTDWGTQLKGLYLDDINFYVGSTAIWTDECDSTSDWEAIGNTLIDGTPIDGAGWIHPPASATPNDFMVAQIVTDMSAAIAGQYDSFTEFGCHSVYKMPVSDSTENGLIHRLDGQRTAPSTELLTLIVIPTT